MQKTDKTLILFTTGFPYGNSEASFLTIEIKYILKAFKKVIIIPTWPNGERTALPPEIQIEDGLSQLLRSWWQCSFFKKLQYFLTAIFSGLFFKEITKRPQTLVQPKVLKNLLVTIIEAQLTKQWLHQFLKTEKIDKTPLLCYSYWLTSCTLGLGLAKKKLPELVTLSRAHGIDLYQERHENSYIPCHMQMMEALDHLFLVCFHGKEYIKEQYPSRAAICEVFGLGVPDTNYQATPSEDNTFRILSCSNLFPFKRLELIIQGIGKAAELKPGQKFQWNHIGGDGAEKDRLEALAKQTFPANVSYHFHGWLVWDEVLAYYQSNPVDIFIHMSNSEARTVAIQEALSFSVPVIAAAVGGIPDIVSNKNGILVSATPSVEEIATALCTILDNPQQTAEKRKQARETWKRVCNADDNYEAFINRISHL